MNTLPKRIMNDIKQIKVSISYQQKEADKLLKMEDELMEYYGYNRSQLHKTLIRDAYRQHSRII